MAKNKISKKLFVNRVDTPLELIGIFGDLNTVASMRICEFGSEAISKSEVFTQEFQTSSLRFRIMHVLMTCTRCLKMICSKIVFLGFIA